MRRHPEVVWLALGLLFVFGLVGCGSDQASVHASIDETNFVVESAEREGELDYELIYPKGQRLDDGGWMSFEIRQYLSAHDIVGGYLYVVSAREEGEEAFDFGRRIFEAGGPSSSDLVPAVGSEGWVDVFHERGAAVVAVSELSHPYEDPLYLRLIDAGGDTVQELMFGPNYEDVEYSCLFDKSNFDHHR